MYADLDTGPLWTHPSSLLGPPTCDSEGALAYSSAALDAYLQTLPPGPTTIIANSMGAAITRGWITLAQDATTNPNDPTLRKVDSVIFIQGAQQGSWLGTAQKVVDQEPNIFGLRDRLTSLLNSVVQSVTNNNLTRPGTQDVLAESQWYQSVNPGHPIPSSLATYNFYSDISVSFTFHTRFKVFGPFGPVDLGDTVMLPGTDNPTDWRGTGGARFLPPGAPRIDHHQYLSSSHLTIDLSNSTANPSILADSVAHAHYGENMSNRKILVRSCRAGVRPLTPTEEILRILTNPSNACS